MKIVIDISAEDFENVKCGRGAVSMMRKAIIHGTPLPEGAGILAKEAYSDLCTRAAEQPDKRTEERTESHACGCISREAVIETIETDCSWDIFNEWGSRTPTGESIIEAIKRVPSVEPERKTGKWIHIVGFWECDQCHAKYMDMPTCIGRVIYEYCPMCGAKMEVQDEQV